LDSPGPQGPGLFLFHVEHVIAAAGYVGIDLDADKLETLGRFRDWLRDEGRRSGGIGPAEGDRIERRHLADSLLFATQFHPSVDRVWDLGTGIGLPGVPLAIVFPGTEFLLIDRSRRRTDMLRRVSRMLDLANCTVLNADIEDLEGEVGVMVSRASLPPEELAPVAARHLLPGGVAIVAGSWVQRPEHPGWTAIEIPRYVLDQDIWLLMMRRS